MLVCHPPQAASQGSHYSPSRQSVGSACMVGTVCPVKIGNMPFMQASLEDEYLAALQALNPGGLADYARKLRRNAGNPRGVYDLLAEGRAALMFLRNGWHVEMRERPDLMLERDGDIIYAEVKHFHRKLQDELDEQVMNAETYDDLDDLLIPVGDTMELEGVPPWRQVANVA